MLSHVDKENLPTMVDVSDKAITQRTAVARATVVFPDEFSRDHLADYQETFHTKKGPVLDTAIIAGVQAAKQTHHLFPVSDSILTKEVVLPYPKARIHQRRPLWIPENFHRLDRDY